MDVDLPVWTIRPNWAQGVLERLEWLTDVLASDTGVEQRRAVRLSPRRSFEITVNPTRADRAYLDLVLHRLGSAEWLFPLWHDQAVLTAAAQPVVPNPPNAPVVQPLAFDNTFREFRDGDYAILYRSTFEWEVVEIASQDDNGLKLTQPLDTAWPRGTQVYPLRRATVQADTALKALTSRVGESVLLFQLNEANDYAEGVGDAMVLYDGSPLLTIEPNRSQTIDLTHTRLYDEADGELGLRYRTDDAGRAFQVQSHNWMIQGREAHSAFRSFLYTLRGRQRMVWLPSFNDDVMLTDGAEATDQFVDIENIGMSYVGGGSPVPGRARLWTGKEVVRIAAVVPLVGGEEERLGLAAPLTEDYAPGASWGFLDAYRLDQDTIELHHHTDSDGTMECAAGFKAFSNVRDDDGSNFLPIFLANKNQLPCGTPGFSGLSWQIPCLTGGSSCNCQDPPDQVYQFGAVAGNLYQVRLRVRGVVETRNYSGGEVFGDSGRCIKNATGGAPPTYNIYALEVSDPPATYYLNHGPGGENFLTVLNYIVTIPVDGSATIKLTARVLDAAQIANNNNAVAPNDDPDLPIVVGQPFQGQFLQIDGSV